MGSEVIVSLVLILPNWPPEGKNPLILPPIVSDSNNVPYTPVNTGYLYDRQDVILICISQLMRQRVYFNVYEPFGFLLWTVHPCALFIFLLQYLPFTLRNSLYILDINLFSFVYIVYIHFFICIQVLFWHVIYLCLNLLSYSHCNMYVIPM